MAATFSGTRPYPYSWCKAREAEALVDKVVFVFQLQVPLPDVWLPFDNLLRQGLHELVPARFADAGNDWQCI